MLVDTAKDHGCRAVVIEDLDFKDARELGRERSSNRPSRGKRGKSFRRTVAGLPTARLRDRLVQMAANAGLSVIAVDPAYTSQWGAEHWLCLLQKISVDASGHHAAALVIARRGLGQRARQRRRCDSTSAEHGGKSATRPVVRSAVAGQPAVLSEPRKRDTGTRKARGQPHVRQKIRPAERRTPVDQVPQDRSGPPTKRDSVPLSVEERFPCVVTSGYGPRASRKRDFVEAAPRSSHAFGVRRLCSSWPLPRCSEPPSAGAGSPSTTGSAACLASYRAQARPTTNRQWGRPAPHAQPTRRRLRSMAGQRSTRARGPDRSWEP